MSKPVWCVRMILLYAAVLLLCWGVPMGVAAVSGDGDPGAAWTCCWCCCWCRACRPSC